MSFQKISLNTRLKRIEAGYSASPQFSRRIIDNFCNTPIIPALESISAFAARQTLCDLMRDVELNEAYKCSDNPTFYDIAAIISKHYLRYGSTPPDTVRSLTDKVQLLIAVYFFCIDVFSVNNNTNHRVVRSSISPFRLNIYDFLQLSFMDYLEYIEQSVDNCNTYNCAKYADKIIDYRTELGFSENMLTIMVYDELKEEFSNLGNFCFEITEDELPRIVHCEHLIEFFVLPIALITSLNKINSQGDFNYEH